MGRKKEMSLKIASLEAQQTASKSHITDLNTQVAELKALVSHPKQPARVKISFSNIVALIALVISALSYRSTHRNHETTVTIQVEQLLAQAWDTLGGDENATVIEEFVSGSGKLERARRLIREAGLLKPDSAHVFLIRGAYYRAMKNYDQAIADYDHAIKLHPQYTSAFNNRGNTHRIMKNYDLAIADFDQAIKLDPLSAVAFNNRGFTYFVMKNYDLAIADFDQAIKLDPQFARAFYNRGYTHHAMKNYDQAIADYDQALKLDPQFAEALNGRAESLEAKGQ